MRSYHVGLISGTSMDGIDAVVVDLSEQPPSILAASTQRFDPDIRRLLDQLRCNPDQFPLAALGRLDALLGIALAKAALHVVGAAGLKRSDITAIGSHGQTVLHRIQARPAHTLQVGDPARIADATGIRTVADFRRADVAAGGQGAPLAPLVHQAFLSAPEEVRVVINLGGIANLSHLAPGQPLTGFDTGPANCFLDLWYRRHQSGPYDEGGRWASTGEADPDWVAQLLDDSYFSLEPPKSTGIEYFSPDWLQQRLPKWASERPQDIQASLAEFSASSLATSVKALQPERVLLCGGGAHNEDLCNRISRHLSDCEIETTDHHGLPVDQVEATLFAWLAAERLARRPIDTRSVTGARYPVLLGTVFEPDPSPPDDALSS